MIKNLTGQHILLIIIVIIIILWFISWLISRSSKSITTTAAQDMLNQYQQAHQNQNSQIVGQTHPVNTQLNKIPNTVIAGPEVPHQHQQQQQQQQQETPFVLYYFYSPTCGYCKQFLPSWNTVVNKLKGLNEITPKTIDATKPENENLAFYYNITGYPTVILTTPDRDIEYTGNRTPDDLYKFVLSNINNNNNTQNDMYPTQNVQYSQHC
jgi:thiol-disulfide isomerase/thioredoxin